MTKQEWNEKWENRPREDLFSTQADFFYSLHLQEIEKIREMIKSMARLENNPEGIDGIVDTYVVDSDEL